MMVTHYIMLLRAQACGLLTLINSEFSPARNPCGLLTFLYSAVPLLVDLIVLNNTTLMSQQYTITAVSNTKILKINT